MQPLHVLADTFSSKEFYNWALVNRAFVLCSLAIYATIDERFKKLHSSLKKDLKHKNSFSCQCLENGQLCHTCSCHKCTSRKSLCAKCQIWKAYIVKYSPYIPTLGELYNNDFILKFDYLQYKKTPENEWKAEVNKEDISETLHLLHKSNLLYLSSDDKKTLNDMSVKRNTVHHHFLDNITKVSDEEKSSIFGNIKALLAIESLMKLNPEDLSNCSAWINEVENLDFSRLSRVTQVYDAVVEDTYRRIDVSMETIDNRIENIEKKIKKVDKSSFYMSMALGIFSVLFLCIMLAFLWQKWLPLPPTPFNETGCPDQNGLFMKYGTILNFVDEGEGAGRAYIYKDLIQKLQDSSGVLMVAETPGLGQSATIENLICAVQGIQSQIRRNLLAFHVCVLDETNTQQPCNLIHNFVTMFSRQLPAYFRYRYEHSNYMNDWLSRCNDDPFGSFTQLLTIPLKEIDEHPVQYILIDNIDECGTCPASLLRVLQKKTVDFPSWVKIIYASNNLPIVTSTFMNLKRLFMSKDDPQHRKNLKVMIRKYSFNLPNKVVDHIVQQVDGNYLCLKIDLQMRVSKANQKMLGPVNTDCLNDYFEKLFDHVFETHIRKFDRMKPVLEVMAATFNPLPYRIYAEIAEEAGITQREFNSLLLDMQRIIQERHKGFLSFVHSYIYTWLSSETKSWSKYVVKLCKGHRRLAEFLIRHSHTIVPLDELARHVFFSSNSTLKDFFREKFADEVISMFSSNWDELLSGKFDKVTSEDIVTLLLFRSNVTNIDRLAFSAAVAGYGNVLYTLLQLGADSSYTSCLLVRPVIYKSRMYQANIVNTAWNMLQVAAVNGSISVIHALMEHNKELVFAENSLGNAFHLALLYRQEDSIRILLELEQRLATREMLMFAVKEGISMGVDLLIEYGAPTDCVPCNKTLTWIDSDTFYLEHLEIYKFKYSQVLKKGREQSKLISDVGRDFWRLTCENPLDVAIYYKEFDISKKLIRHNRDLTRCHHYTGRLPIMTAVKHQNKPIFSYLLDLEEPMLGECKSFNFYKRQQLIKVLCQNPVFGNTCELAMADHTTEERKCSFGSQIESAIHYYAKDSDIELIFNQSVWAEGDFVRSNRSASTGSMSLYYSLCIDTSFLWFKDIKGCKKLLRNNKIKVLFQETWCRMKPFPLRQSQIQCQKVNNSDADVYVTVKQGHTRNYSNETKILTDPGNQKGNNFLLTVKRCESLQISSRHRLPMKHQAQNATLMFDWTISGITLLDYPEDFVFCLQMLAIRGNNFGKSNNSKLFS